MNNELDSSVNLIECINTFQGEGPDSGRRMLLCRFKYCNLTCPWCDTIVKMRVLQEGSYKLSQLQDIMNEQRCGLMITGGEPTFSNQLAQTILMLNNLQYTIANVETNGLELDYLIKNVYEEKNIKYIFSPKFSTEKDVLEIAKKIEKLLINPNVYYKIVVLKESRFIDSLLQKIGNTKNVFLMPEGKNRDELFENAPRTFDLAEKYKCNFSSRTHLIYDFV